MLQRIHDENRGLHRPSRRQFLRGLAAVVPTACLLTPMSKAMASMDIRSLRVQHLHTGEQLSAVYYARGRYVPETLAAIDHLLRDFRTDQEHPIDTSLLDLLFDVSLKIGRNVRFQVISGYRSPATNAMLRRKSRHVAERSLHTQGRAIDVRVQGMSAVLLRNAAVAMRRGGVGYYPNSDFVHLDTGRVRHW